MKLSSLLFTLSCVTSVLPQLAIAAPSSASSNQSVVAANKLDVNRATLAQLQAIKGLGKTKAQAIINYRKSKGQIRSINELLAVKGIGAKLLIKLQEKLSVAKT